jgi:hypothetical protein
MPLRQDMLPRAAVAHAATLPPLVRSDRRKYPRLCARRLWGGVAHVRFGLPAAHASMSSIMMNMSMNWKCWRFIEDTDDAAEERFHTGLARDLAKLGLTLLEFHAL